MTKLLISTIVGLMIIGFNGCTPTSDIKVEKATSKKVDLRGYKTYAPLLAKGVLVDSQGIYSSKNMNLEAEINNMIKTELDKRGKEQVMSNPDFLVAYVAGVDMDVIRAKVRKQDQIQLTQVPAASLAILFIDAQTNALIWMAVSEGELRQDLDVEKTRKRLHYAIRKMLRGINY
jgi:hypothetical protein